MSGSEEKLSALGSEQARMKRFRQDLQRRSTAVSKIVRALLNRAARSYRDTDGNQWLTGIRR